MAAPDDTSEEDVVRKPAVDTSWRPSTAVSLLGPTAPQAARPSQVSDWFKAVLGATGRGAPAGAR